MCEALKKSYQVFEEIGRGRFGTVHRAFSAAASEFVAVKLIDKRVLSDDLDRACLDREPKIMSFLGNHPNVLTVIDVFDGDETLAVVLELCDSSTLFDRIADRPMSESESAAVMRQLLSALAHCHRHGIVHRDLKPENVLFDSRAGDTLKLADFGSADFLGDDGKVAGIFGTPYYVAPEVILGRDYDEKVDVWSAGVILYAMLAGFPPFYGESAAEIFEAVIRANLRFPTRVFRSVSSSAKDLMRKMICRDPCRRLSAEQALRHPWILSGGGGGEIAVSLN